MLFWDQFVCVCYWDFNSLKTKLDLTKQKGDNLKGN